MAVVDLNLGDTPCDCNSSNLVSEKGGLSWVGGASQELVVVDTQVGAVEVRIGASDGTMAYSRDYVSAPRGSVFSDVVTGQLFQLVQAFGEDSPVVANTKVFGLRCWNDAGTAVHSDVHLTEEFGGYTMGDPYNLYAGRGVAAFKDIRGYWIIVLLTCSDGALAHAYQLNPKDSGSFSHAPCNADLIPRQLGVLEEPSTYQYAIVYPGSAGHIYRRSLPTGNETRIPNSPQIASSHVCSLGVNPTMQKWLWTGYKPHEHEYTAYGEMDLPIIMCNATFDIPVPDIPPPFCRSTGDPHFSAWSHRSFDFHGRGEYILARLNSSKASHAAEIHTCQQDAAPQWTSATGNTMLAVHLPGSGITVTVLPASPAPAVTVSCTPVACGSVTGLTVDRNQSVYKGTTITLPSTLQVHVHSWSSSSSHSATRVFLSIYLEMPNGEVNRYTDIQGDGLCGPVTLGGLNYDITGDQDYSSAALYSTWKVPASQTFFPAVVADRLLLTGEEGTSFYGLDGLYPELASTSSAQDGSFCEGDGYFKPPCPNDDAVRTLLNASGFDADDVRANCLSACNEPDAIRYCMCDIAVMGDPSAVYNHTATDCTTVTDHGECIDSGDCT
ncbi:hypothetical protein CYMTET_12914, partial [Cymbomonas tetramitiformis]